MTSCSSRGGMGSGRQWRLLPQPWLWEAGSSTEPSSLYNRSESRDARTLGWSCDRRSTPCFASARGAFRALRRDARLRGTGSSPRGRPPLCRPRPRWQKKKRATDGHGCTDQAGGMGAAIASHVVYRNDGIDPVKSLPISHPENPAILSIALSSSLLPRWLAFHNETGRRGLSSTACVAFSGLAVDDYLRRRFRSTTTPKAAPVRPSRSVEGSGTWVISKPLMPQI